jgi:hypothetical protein
METYKELELLVNIINKKLFESQCCTLNNAEVAILKGVWESQPYSQIAKNNSYSSDYLSNVVAPELYRRLTDLFGQRITKKNCRVMIESYATKQNSVEIALPPEDPNKLITTVDNNTSPCYPNGAVPLNSCFYIKRFNTEEDLYKEVCNPGALIRIKAPKEMGKTSLVLTILRTDL